jgi:hypothetical protein
MTDKHPKRPGDLKGPLWRLRHNTAQMARATSPLDVPLHPNLGSWLNAVEGFFAKLTRRRLKRGVFRSLVDLQVAINRFLAETNSTPKPFVWTADPKRVLAAVKREKEALESIHKQSRKSAFKRSLRR